MKSAHSHGVPAAGATGFTLIELLTAVAVLALVLVMMLQVVNGVLQSTQLQNRQMDTVSSVRRALDALAADLRLCAISDSSTVLVGDNGEIVLLARRRGPEGATDHRLLAVKYATNGGGDILRSYGSLPYTNTSPLEAAVVHANTVSTNASGILQMQVRVITESTNYPASASASENWATNSYNRLPVPTGYKALIAAGPRFATDLTNRARAIEIWVAATDPQSAEILGTNSISWDPDPANWRDNIDEANIPPRVKSAARVLNKTIPLP